VLVSPYVAGLSEHYHVDEVGYVNTFTIWFLVLNSFCMWPFERWTLVLVRASTLIIWFRVLNTFEHGLSNAGTGLAFDCSF